MGEHVVLRRILVIYRESARALRACMPPAAALGQAAALFYTFGENYHERKLEEQPNFPAVRSLGGEAGGLVAMLQAQHNRGRAITAFIASQCGGGRIGASDCAAMADTLDGFARMYEAHTAIEDTLVFQAWRKSLSPKALEVAGDQFESIERAQFHGEGFDMAVDQMRQIEQRMGLTDLGRYTVPAPPEDARAGITS